MSLDFYLEERELTTRECTCRDCGDKHAAQPYAAQLFHSNITHNLGSMFNEAGVYGILWRGDGRVAGAVVEQLEVAYRVMLDDPPRFEKFNAKNGWGLYEHAVPFLADVIRACREHPEGVLRCST